MTRNIRPFLFGSLLALTLVARPGLAGVAQQNPADDWCRDQSWGDDRAGVCEVKEFLLPATGATMTVDASPNGGVVVQGSSRGDILVLARIVATASTPEGARALAQRVQVIATADRVQAEGPTGLSNRESWHVSYRVEAPTGTPMSLRTVNGGISIAKMNGQIEFRTVNGGVKLRDVGGAIQGRTTNGGIDVDLEGAAWVGDGLNVETMNGGVRLAIPAGYSAHLETGTTNGGISIDRALASPRRGQKTIAVDLGSGGAPLRIRTSNGGVKVQTK